MSPQIPIVQLLLPLFSVVMGALLGTFLSRQGWASQKRWEVRKDLYLDLLKNLDIARTTLAEIQEANDYFESDPLLKAEKKRKVEAFEVQNHEASQNVRNAIDRIGILFLSEDALKILNDYLNAERNRIQNLEDIANENNHAEIGAEMFSWDFYMDNESKAARLAYEKIVSLAKEDLQIVIEPSIIKRLRMRNLYKL